VYIDAIGDAWRMVTQDLATWICAGLVLFALTSGVSMVISFVVQGSIIMSGSRGGPDLGLSILSSVLQVVIGIAFWPLQVGISAMAVKVARGQAVQVGDVFGAYRRFWPVVGTMFLSMVASGIGLCLCIVPGIFLFGALSMAPLIAFDQEVDPIEALTRSYRTLGRDAWMMFLVMFVAGLLNIAGILVCCVGVLVTMPMYMATVGLSYHYLFPPAGTQPGTDYEYRPPAQA
jgi:uncharacterized membrane protein